MKRKNENIKAINEWEGVVEKKGKESNEGKIMTEKEDMKIKMNYTEHKTKRSIRNCLFEKEREKLREKWRERGKGKKKFNEHLWKVNKERKCESEWGW